ncbi:conserved Plasmodium protein, unknown function [Plasmodium chabaudi chabaudi]|uniref:Uncharacterized protein n=1 Tax=Plasmodium chabaudi chabaudi TaxID=31271 RepID=A0A4V0K1H8_PLACU|nr:conserved Plasmodium protein, unknown function [Plasmodium chabaudi chabaudi]VTZ66310.1 conserved Plasmodium protein, unknown function [Plasmodium chabaudi chabaudi]|eukprot:XP_744138.2 conserved Plasmodium protein, unknown function [Plasmodium chabaudi chabaudi]
MIDAKVIGKLNSILKCNPRKQEKRHSKSHTIENDKYFSRTNLIGEKYIKKIINEYGNDLANIIDTSSDSNAKEKLKRLQNKDQNNDIELTYLNNFEIDHRLCKVKGKNLYEGTAGKINEIIVETLNKSGQCVYVENSIFEAYIKKKENVDKLNYVREYPKEDNGYDSFINNNLYNEHLYKKHESLINFDYNRYNVNSIFSNYKNIKKKELNGDDSINFGDHSEYNDQSKICEKKKNQLNNSDIYKTDINKSKQKNKNISDDENRHYNETIKNAYIFEPLEYDDQNIKLTTNSIKCNVRDLKNGTYVISYAIRKSGQYYLSIFYKKKPVANTPYNITIKPSAAYAPNCVVYKYINHRIIVPANKKNKNKTNKDRGLLSPNHENSLHDHSVKFEHNWKTTNAKSNTANIGEASIFHQTIETQSNTSSDYSNNECDKFYDSSHSEKNNSVYNEDSIDYKNMYVLKFDDKEDNEENKKFNNFFIQCYDAYKNKIKDGNETFEVTGLGDIKITKVNNLSNGIYEVIYKYVKKNYLKYTEGDLDAPSNDHTYREIKVKLNGCHVKGSPFQIILKNDKKYKYLNKLKNLLPITNINEFNPIGSLNSIINSYKYIKTNYLTNEDGNIFMNLNPYYKNKEIDNILKKVDANLISIMSIPMKEQLFNYIRHINHDQHIVKLKNILFKELITSLYKIINCSEQIYQELEEDEQNLVKLRQIQNGTISDVNIMYQSLKNKNVHTLPFDFSINDMKLYEQKLKETKKKLLEKQKELINKYTNIKNKEQQFYKDREDITKQLVDKYELHRAMYDRSKNALIQTNANLKKITLTNINQACKREKKLTIFRGTNNLDGI